MLEESLRRTWWELVFSEGILSGLYRHQRFTRATYFSDVLLPCEETDYENLAVPDPSSLMSLVHFDKRIFDPNSATFSSYSYRIEAVRIFVNVLTLTEPDSNMRPSQVHAWRNRDLIPLSPDRAIWSSWDFLYLWSTVFFTTFGWQITSSLLGLGLNVWQAILCNIITKFLQTAVVLCVGWPGGVWHVGFTVSCRYVFGMWGSYIPVILRIFLCIIWYGVQAFTGGQLVAIILSTIFSGYHHLPNTLPASAAMTTKQFVGYLIFNLIALGLLWVPPDKLKKPFKLITSINLLVILGLAIGLIASARGGSLGTLQTSQRHDNLGWSFIHGIAVVFSGNAVGMASHSDFSRFARRPGAQVSGQIFSFLISGNIVPILGIFGTAAAAKMYGDVNALGLWNPPNILQLWLDHHYHNPAMRAATFFVAFGLTSSIMALNSIENGVSGGMDVAGLYPRYFNIRRGSYLLAAVSVLIQPWQIIANGAIFTATLNSFGVILFPLMGTMVADYYVVRRQQIKLSDLYRADVHSIYWFHRGFNWRAFAAWLVGFAPSIPGLAALKPHNKGIPIGLTYTFYLWPLVGFFASFALHVGLNYVSPPQGLGTVDEQEVETADRLQSQTITALEKGRHE
ncbi:permease for cytosine/purines, uracil, thiamine, allantoin-domain-containing protein [Aspergillus coremiiformis]|uniref:Permease for cytosine/purines, uracil, thiamine, allantoin-domain-containing protein n=1 Tax=Aspergillus coremiiformis TaxID=138285 RepID=A0A5N6ZH36_9EURO|nr:permease for cytosine/purines, uracil, thiamine, allantoin-domain-containing protein [Aspergillus coremiiformis]